MESIRVLISYISKNVDDAAKNSTRPKKNLFLNKVKLHTKKPGTKHP